MFAHAWSPQSAESCRRNAGLSDRTDQRLQSQRAKTKWCRVEVQDRPPTDIENLAADFWGRFRWRRRLTVPAVRRIKKIAPQAQSKSLPHGALIEIRNAPATVSGFEDAARAKDGRRSISHLRRQVARHFHPSANFTNFRGRPCHGVVSFYGSASSSSPGSQELNVSYHGARTTVKRLLSGRSRNFHNFAHVPTRGWPASIRDPAGAFGKGPPIVDLWWKAVASTGEIHSYWHNLTRQMGHTFLLWPAVTAGCAPGQRTTPEEFWQKFAKSEYMCYTSWIRAGASSATGAAGGNEKSSKPGRLGAILRREIFLTPIGRKPLESPDSEK